MAHEVDMNDAFARMVLAEASESGSSEPTVYYNKDGDCIEFLTSSESYYAERIDNLVTVYYGRDSGEIIGSLIKGVTHTIKDILEVHPGFAIEIQDGRVKLSHIFTAEMWSHGDDISVATYQSLRNVADNFRLEVDVPEYA